MKRVGNLTPAANLCRRTDPLFRWASPVYFDSINRSREGWGLAFKEHSGTPEAKRTAPLKRTGIKNLNNARLSKNKRWKQAQ